MSQFSPRWPICLLIVGFLLPECATSQDSSLEVLKKIVTLTEVVVRNNLNVPDFIQRVQTDTSFYKAFKNLHLIGYTALNDIRMTDKKGEVRATLQSRTKQDVHDGCRTMQTLEESITGDMYDNDRNWNYYTAELYAGLFFTKGTICGETNIVRGNESSLKGKSGMAKNKEQLKKLLFNPGAKIPGIPFIGNKIAIFEEGQSELYDFIIDMADYKGQNCYVFRIKARENLSRAEKGQVVINTITTWFNSRTMQIVARNYDLNYDAGVYDFNVQMEVQLTEFQELLVPSLIRYTGNWHAIFKKKEKGIFTATLFDFNSKQWSAISNQ